MTRSFPTRRSSDLLPNCTTRTMRLSANAARIRDLFKRAHDPNRFLFDDIPGTLGEDVALDTDADLRRSEEHTSELQSLMRISYAVFCLKKKNQQCTKNLVSHIIIER